MHTTGKDGAEGDPQEHHGAPQSALHGTKDGAKARNVQQLDEKQLPLGHHNVVNAVVNAHSRRFTVVRAEGIVHDLAIDEVSAHQDRKTEQETNHTRNLLFAPAGRGPILPHTRGSFLASW